MLKGIPSNVSSELLKALADMGHGDVVIVADHFFPAASMVSDKGVVVEAKGNGTVDMIKSILKLIPLDSDYEEYPVQIISPDPGFEYTLPERPALWDEIIAAVAAEDAKAGVGFIHRGDFYKVAQKAYLIVSTSEEQPYGCVILQKGVK